MDASTPERNTHPMHRLLAHPLPILEDDFQSGQVAAFVDHVHRCFGFSDLPRRKVQDLVAQGFGYSDWSTMRAGPAEDCLDEPAQFPQRDFDLVHAIAWRIYRRRRHGLMDAYMACLGAWCATALLVRKEFYHPWMGCPDGFADRPAFSEELREHLFPEDIDGPENLQLLDQEIPGRGRAWCNHRFEVVEEVTSCCWTPGCGITAKDLEVELRQGCVVPLDVALRESWYSSEVFPVGLSPAQFEDEQGQLLGYGWWWEEMHRYLAYVFATPEDFVQSGVALWLRQSPKAFARPALPKLIRSVDFVNPFRVKDATRSEDGGADRPPHIAHVLRSRGALLEANDTQDIDGDPWTAELYRFSGTELRRAQELLGLDPVSPKQTQQAARDLDWLGERVPGLLSQDDFATLCESVALDDALSARWDNTLQAPQMYELEQLVVCSASVAKRSISRQTKDILESQHDTLEGSDAADAAPLLGRLYPELQNLGALQIGEYALALYGKDDLRGHYSARHRTRDTSFLRYAVLRNLGLDPEEPGNMRWRGVFEAVRAYCRKNPQVWVSAKDLETLRCGAASLLMAVHAHLDALENLDPGMSPYRMQWLGMRT